MSIGEDTALNRQVGFDVKDGKGNDFAVSPADPAELDLFSHVYDENIIATAGTQKIIAPALVGFCLKCTNKVCSGKLNLPSMYLDCRGCAIEYSLKPFDDETFVKATDAMKLSAPLQRHNWPR